MTKFSIRSLTCLALAASVMTGCAFKKMKKKQETVTYECNPKILELKGDSVSFDYQVLYPKKYFAKKATVEITPVLKFKSDSALMRTGYLRGEKVDGDGTMILKKEGDTATFGDRFFYTDAMAKSELYADLVAKKGKKTVPFARVKLADGIITTSRSVKTTDELIYSKDNYAKVVPVEQKGTIYFEVNKSLIRESEKKGSEMAAFGDFVKKGNNLTGVAISSYASPEGELTRNSQLAKERTKATYSYLLGYLKKLGVNQVNDSSFYKRSATSEDWDGLKAIAQGSDLQDREAVVRLINGLDDPAERERELKKLSSYKRIAENILPKLRRSEVTFLATEKRRPDDQILSLAKETPNVLTAEELLYAATLTQDKNEQIDIYEKFVKIYPEDWRGYNSMACVALDNNDLAKAEDMLTKASVINKNNAAVYNNMGVLFMRKRNYKMAEQNFSQAKQLGAREDVNMGNLKVRTGDYKAAIGYYGSTNAATYNSALANTLAGNYDAALANIDGIKEPDASVFYLKAIIGARKGDQNLMNTNITRAIRVDASYREKALGDMEFFKFRDTDNFRAAVK